MNDWLRRGEILPDGREVLMIHSTGWICCDPSIIERKNKGLTIPDPGDPPAPDGYQTRWERCEN
jgi:hypothetical protein